MKKQVEIASNEMQLIDNFIKVCNNLKDIPVKAEEKEMLINLFKEANFSPESRLFLSALTIIIPRLLPLINEKL